MSHSLTAFKAKKSSSLDHKLSYKLRKSIVMSLYPIVSALKATETKLGSKAV